MILDPPKIRQNVKVNLESDNLSAVLKEFEGTQALLKNSYIIEFSFKIMQELFL